MNEDAEPTGGRHPNPPGTVSTIRGAKQVPALRVAIVTIMALALFGTVLPGDLGDALAWSSIALLIATPLLRVCWLIHRWRQEADRRFVLIGISMIAVTLIGAGLALLQA